MLVMALRIGTLISVAPLMGFYVDTSHFAFSYISYTASDNVCASLGVQISVGDIARQLLCSE